MSSSMRSCGCTMNGMIFINVSSTIFFLQLSISIFLTGVTLELIHATYQVNSDISHLCRLWHNLMVHYENGKVNNKNGIYYRLEGILIAYNHVRIQQLFGTIMTSQPDVHFDVVAEFIIFQPTPGSVLKAVVSKTEKSSVGCIVHGCFNASFFVPFHEDSNATSEYQVCLPLGSMRTLYNTKNEVSKLFTYFAIEEWFRNNPKDRFLNY